MSICVVFLGTSGSVPTLKTELAIRGYSVSKGAVDV